MKPGVLFLSVLPWAASGGCLPVSGDRIFARDLALLDARFAPLPASLTIASAPSPGVRRIFAAAELTRLARAHGIELVDPVEVCFEIPLQVLSPDEALEEMRRVLPGAELALVELSRSPVPSGPVEFPIAGLEPASVTEPGVQLWRGYVRYSATRKAAVWARVRISQTITAVIVDSDLAANRAIDASALRVERRSGSPVVQEVATRIEDVAGRIPRKALKAGALIPLSVLGQAPDVRRGDAVQVQVVCGTAHLRLSAVAERDGHSGELLELRNPSSGKTFRARLDGPRAIIVVGTESGL